MISKTKIFLCLTLLVLCPLAMAICFVDSPTVHTQEILNIFSPGYEESLPIYISNNTDFANQVALNSWDGNGSVSDPYIIEGLNITTSGNSAIQIGNTTVFFEVRGSLIVGGSIGILLQNVTNAKVWNTTIQDSDSCGLLVTESNSVIVTNNTIRSITGADSAGLYSLGSNYCEFTNNTIGAVSGWGFLIDYSNNCSISENYVSSAAYDGIRLRDSSENNITLNEITHSHLSGIKIGNSHRCKIEENLVKYSVEDGISIEVSSQCRIKDNVLYWSGGYSVDVAGDSTDIIANTFYVSWLQGLRCQANNNNITLNNFIENNQEFSVIASYLIDLGSNNIIIENYYDVWTWPDLDENDIVDRPYLYDEVREHSDNEPHVKVFQTDLMHILTKPILIFPNETMSGEKFWGPVQLRWSVSSDTFGHDATYNVSVSNNGGTSWIEIGHDLVDTNLEWNSSEYTESAEYRFKVIAQCTDGLVSEYTTGVEYEVKNHNLSAPTVLTPNGGESIFGNYDITWSDAVESWGLPVTYDIYYSLDAGETWSELTDSIEDNSFVWDISGIPDGNQYLIRVVARSASGLVSEDVSDLVFTISRPNVTVIGVSVVGGVVAVVIIVYILRRRGTTL